MGFGLGWFSVGVMAGGRVGCRVGLCEGLGPGLDLEVGVG